MNIVHYIIHRKVSVLNVKQRIRWQLNFIKKNQEIRPGKFTNEKIMRAELFLFNEFIEEKRRETKECFSFQFFAAGFWTMITIML